MAAPVPAVIDRFTNNYRFLSNFYPCRPPGIQLHLGLSGKCDLYFPTVEHAYQASKSTADLDWGRMAILSSPLDAKRLGKYVSLRPDWERVKEDIMLHLLKQKFMHSPLRQMLLDTGEARLVEGNWWGDTYWGVCNGVGRNVLGNLLELVRFQLNHPEVYPDMAVVTGWDVGAGE